MLYKFKIYSLLLFTFSLPFEYWDPLGVASFLTVTKIAGFAYFVTSLYSLSKSFDRKYVGSQIHILLLLWGLMSILSMVNYWSETTIPIFNFTFFQNIILFWLIATDIIYNRKLIVKIFLSFIIGVSLMAVLASFGIGLGIEEDAGNSRLTFFGLNSNVVGALLSIAFLLILVFLFHKKKYIGNWAYLFLLAIPLILSLIGLTGSRGTLVVVVVGSMFFLITYNTSIVKKILMISAGAFVMLFAINIILDSEIMQKRLDKTTEEGSLGGREFIWENALELYMDRPVLGYGAVGYQKAYLIKHGKYNDTHNLFLYFLVTSGLVGFSLFMIFLFRVTKSAIYIFQKEKDILYLLLLVVYLITAFKAGGIINNKTMWLLLACIYASKYSLIVSQKFHKNENTMRD